MSISKATLLAALGLATATSAHAASLIQYDIIATGTRASVGGTGNPPATSSWTYQFTHIIDAGSSNYSFSDVDLANRYIQKTGSYSASGGKVVFTEQHSQHHLSANISGSFCADGSASGFPTSAMAPPSCGQVSYDYLDYNMGDPISYSFSGTISSITARSFDGELRSTGFGLMRVTNAVPEPASWMLMLAGFALLAGHVRFHGRRRKVVVA